jgi:hypothetical protein
VCHESGWPISVLKEKLAELRPLIAAAKSYQRTSYLAGP